MNRNILGIVTQVALPITALTSLLSNLGATRLAAMAHPTSPMGIGNGRSVVAAPPFARVPPIASTTSGGWPLTARLGIMLAATIALLGWANGWLNSPTNPSDSASIAAVQDLAFVEPPPVVPPIPGAKVPVKPFIMVVKTDQAVKATDGMSPSGPNQFMLPLMIDYDYDFTVDWGDGSTEVVRLPFSATFRELLNQEVEVKVKSTARGAYISRYGSVRDGKDTRGDALTLEEAVADLGKVTQALIMIDPKSGGGFGQQTPLDNLPFVNYGGRSPPPDSIVVEKKTMRDILEPSSYFDTRYGYHFALAFNMREKAIILSDGKKERGDLFFSHTYANAGTYTVKVTENVPGGFPAMRFNGEGDRQKLLEISQWGDGTWSSMESAYLDCENLSITATDSTTARTGAVKNFSKAWSGCPSLTNFPLINTAAGTDFRGAWSGCSSLTSFPLLNTAAGKNFNSAWSRCSSLTSFPLLNTSAGTNFSYAWFGCRGLTSFPLLNTAAGTNFGSAWPDCSGLTSFPLLNTAAGTNFGSAWSGCRGLTSFPLLNTAAGTNFNWAWTGCSGLTSFPALNTAAGTDFHGAWSGCSGLTSFPLLNTEAGTDLGRAWSGCSGLTSFPMLKLGKMKNGYDMFSGVTLTSDAYDDLLNHIAASNANTKVTFDGGLSKVQGLIGIQARKKLITELGWTVRDGDSPKSKPEQNKKQPEPPPKPVDVNDF